MRFLADPRWELSYLRGDYEPWVQDYLARWLRRGSTYCDVGAHVGFFTLCAARIVGTEGMVWAFEADPENFGRLVSNVAANALTRVVIAQQLAVWDMASSVSFARASEYSSRVQGCVQATEERTLLGSHALRIPALPLHTAIPSVPEVIKVDVEGGELRVLAGAERILEARRSRWLVEAHSSDLADAVCGIFQQHGYLVEVLQPRHPKYPDYRQRYIIACPA